MCVVIRCCENVWCWWWWGGREGDVRVGRQSTFAGVVPLNKTVAAKIGSRDSAVPAFLFTLTTNQMVEYKLLCTPYVCMRFFWVEPQLIVPQTHHMHLGVQCQDVCSIFFFEECVCVCVCVYVRM